MGQLLNECDPETRSKILDLMSYCLGIDPKGSFKGDPWSGDPGDKKLIAQSKTLAAQLIASDPGLRELVDLVLELSH